VYLGPLVVVGCLARKYMSALTSFLCRFAQRRMPLSGAMIVLPHFLNEYSTAIGFDLVTHLRIKPVDSRLRRVLVSIRCDMLPT
jgi:hypothetical protein